MKATATKINHSQYLYRDAMIISPQLSRLNWYAYYKGRSISLPTMRDCKVWVDTQITKELSAVGEKRSAAQKFRMVKQARLRRSEAVYAAAKAAFNRQIKMNFGQEQITRAANAEVAAHSERNLSRTMLAEAEQAEEAADKAWFAAMRAEQG